MIHVVCINHHGAIYKVREKKRKASETGHAVRGQWAAENPYILGPGRDKITVNMVHINSRFRLVIYWEM